MILSRPAPKTPCLSRHINLSGQWQCKGTAPSETGKSVECDALVPGHVHQDLLAAGLIKDPFWRDQAQDCQWVEEWTWSFEREFEIGPDFALEKVVLDCSGLDTYARVYLNGHDVGAAANMFVPHSWDVTRLLRRRANHIRIEFTPHGQAVAGRPFEKYFSCFSGDRVFTRRLQCTFGWDWVHRFVSVGIWRPISLRSTARGRWLDCAFRTLRIAPAGALIEVEVAAESPALPGARATCELLDPDGRVVWDWGMPLAEFRETAGSGRLECSRQFSLRDPQLWWPHGEGDQNLYTLKLRLLDADDVEVDVREEQVGIRTINLLREPVDDGETFFFEVNGRRIFARGANWVPADPFPSRITPATYDHLIRLAKEANFNMLRTWGGGIYEPEAFWRACNRHGILVIQDFLMACANYPEDDPEFFAMLRHEFEQAVRCLRNHPALAMWTGSNELGMNAVAGDPFNGKRVCEEISRALCAALDPTRPFLLTCPHTPDSFREGPEGTRTNNWPKAGDSHQGVLYEPDFLRSDMRDFRARFAATAASFLSECPVFNSPPWHSLMKFLTPEDLEDRSRQLMEFRTKDNPYNDFEETHLQLLERIAATLFGEFHDVRDRIRKMEAVGRTGIRLTLEALRMKPERCAGVLFWMFNDCWPASGWSLVDYYGLPKAGYYGFKTGAAPVIGAFDMAPGNAGGLKVCNDTGRPVTAHVTLHGFGHGERRGVELLSEALEVGGRSCGSAGHIAPDWRDFGLLVLDTRTEYGLDRTTLFSGLPAEFEFPPAHLQWQVIEESPGQGEVRISTDAYAHMVTLEGEAIFDQNYFDLLPGEERVVRWRSHGDAARAPVSECCCLNAVRAA